MKDFTIGMALTDFVPVLLFAAAAVLLQRDLYHKMSKGAFALFAAGSIDIFCAGALKATYKLLYAMKVCDFEPLSDLFFPLQAIGFLLAGIGLAAMLFCRQKKSSVLYSAAVPVLYKGTLLFVSAMVLGLAGMNTVLGMISCKMKKPAACVCFVLSFVFSLAMGYLSSRDFTAASMNWIAQGVNVLGQGTFLAGTLILHREGLEHFVLKQK